MSTESTAFTPRLSSIHTTSIEHVTSIDHKSHRLCTTRRLTASSVVVLAAAWGQYSAEANSLIEAAHRNDLADVTLMLGARSVQVGAPCVRA